MKLIKLTGLLLLAAGCTHGIDISGEGDVVAVENQEARSCFRESAPCTWQVSGSYFESYFAVPREGQAFTGWEVCGDEISSVCTFNVPANVVSQFNGQTMPNSVANFAAIDRTSIDGIYDGIYSLDGEPHDIRCIITREARALCSVEDPADDSLLSVLDMQLDLLPADDADLGGLIEAGTGIEYWQPDGFNGFELTEINGLYRGRDQIVMSFESGGDSTEISMSYNDFYDVAMPFRSFGGAQNTFTDNRGVEVTSRFDRIGNYTADYGDCELNIQIESLGVGLASYNAVAQSDCDFFNDSYTGIGFTKFNPQMGFLDQEIVFISDQEDGTPLTFSILNDL